MHSRRFEGKRSGPRDVFGYEPIRLAVTGALVRLGMGGDQIVELLGVEDHAAEIRALAPGRSEPDMRAALLAWTECHAFEERHMSKSYASACGRDLRSFVTHWQGGESHERHEWAVRCRVNREVRVALALWLGIDPFAVAAEERIQSLHSVISPACEEHDRWMAHITQLAFAGQLRLPLHERVETLWSEAVVTACAAPIPDACRDGGEPLCAHLLSMLDDLIARDIRPFAAPAWPEGATERVRSILKALSWEGEEIPEVALMCDVPEVNRACDAAFREYKDAKAAGDADAIREASARVMPLQRQAHALYMGVPNDHERRCATRARIAARLAEAAPELIELVRPTP